MQDFEDALRQFLAGTLPFADLGAAAAKIAENDSLRARAVAALERENTAHALPPQIYASLKALLDDRTRSAAPVDLTRRVPPRSPGSSPVTADTTAAAPFSETKPAPAARTSSLLDPTSLGSGAGTEPGLEAVLKERFVLKQVLGVGGMGTVFKALDLRKVEANDKEAYVAIKLLNPDFRSNPMALMALQRETKRAQTLSHPNIINVYDFDRDGQNVFMSMEYLSGRPLSHYIKERVEGGIRFRQAWPIIEAMGEALAHAHRKGVIHSDFKPGNVFIDDSGDVRVLDFGIACAVTRKDGNAGETTAFNARDLGALTPAYASLEQLHNQPPDPRDDIYALACVTYELLTGKHPFGKLPADKALELKLQPKPVAGLRRSQWKGLQRALALEQETRTPDVATFLDALRPRSSWYYAVAFTVAVILGLTAANVYLSMMAPDAAKQTQRTVQISAEQRQKIVDLLELAAAHFDVGFLTAPTGSNALWAYQEVLKIDPYNEAAIKGIKKIADTLEQEAWEAYEKGDRSGSMKKVMDGLEADPGHVGLSKLKAKLQG